MKRLLVLVGFVIGCGGDDPGADGPPPAGNVVLRTAFSNSTDAAATQLVVPGDPAVQEGDVLIALIQARTVDAIEIIANPGWTVLVDDLAVLCAAMFHTWFLTTVATTNTTFDFTFDVPDTFTTLVTAYSGGANTALMDFKKMGELRGMEIFYPATALAPGSIVWMGGGAQTNWTSFDTPIGTTPVIAADDAAAFELGIADGNVPAIELPNEDGLCANVAQISVQP